MVAKEIIDYEEHIYTSTFDDLVKNGAYNKDTKKIEIPSKRVPLIKTRYDTILGRKGIKPYESVALATMLGLSKVQHDDRVKEILKI